MNEIEEEFRSQNTFVRIKTLVPLYETRKGRYRYAISLLFRPTTELLHHKTRKFGGGAKTPIIQTLRTVALSERECVSKSCHAVGFTLRYPPVIQNTGKVF